MTAQFFRMHTGWYLDARIQSLLAAGKFDAVILFYALIAHARHADSDGQISAKEVRNVANLCHLVAERRNMRVLTDSGLITIVGQSRYEITAYNRWQTTSDQRKRGAERVARNRSRNAPGNATGNGSGNALEREIERERRRNAVARAVAAADGAPEAPRRLGGSINEVMEGFGLSGETK